MFSDESYSLCTFLTGVVQSGDVELNGTPTSQCDFMTVMAVDRFGCVRVSLCLTEPLHIVQGRVTGQYYRDSILTPFVLPFARRVGRYCVQDDNGRAHRARTVNAHLQQHNIYRMSWPAMSTDLSPTDHVWDMMGKQCSVIVATVEVGVVCMCVV